LYPTLARFAGDASALRSKARDALRLVLMLGALASAGTALYADVAVSLVFRRDGFEPAIDVLRALAPYLFLMFVNILLGSAILVAGALLRNAPLPVRFVVPLIVFAVAIRATGLFTVADGRRIWEAARLRSEASRA